MEEGGTEENLREKVNKRKDTPKFSRQKEKGGQTQRWRIYLVKEGDDCFPYGEVLSGLGGERVSEAPIAMPIILKQHREPAASERLRESEKAGFVVFGRSQKKSRKDYSDSRYKS